MNYVSSNTIFKVDHRFIVDICLDGSYLKDDSERREILSDLEYEKLRKLF